MINNLYNQYRKEKKNNHQEEEEEEEEEKNIYFVEDADNESIYIKETDPIVKKDRGNEIIAQLEKQESEDKIITNKNSAITTEEKDPSRTDETHANDDKQEETDTNQFANDDDIELDDMIEKEQEFEIKEEVKKKIEDNKKVKIKKTIPPLAKKIILFLFFIISSVAIFILPPYFISPLNELMQTIIYSTGAGFIALAIIAIY